MKAGRQGYKGAAAFLPPRSLPKSLLISHASEYSLIDTEDGGIEETFQEYTASAR
jgi:hypothetical protein